MTAPVEIVERASAAPRDRDRGPKSARGIAISADRISKSFLLIDEGDAFRIAFASTRDIPRFEALKDVTIRAPKGRFIGIIGPNGAGKTTLLRTLGGIYAPDSGVVSISGELGAIYELGVAGNPFLTGRQYAERMLVMRGVPARERPAMLADVVEFSELGDRIDDRIQGYSTGMAARLFFAVATAGHYDVYLIDEVLAVGDQYFQAKCWRRIRQRLENGASGVLVTHDWTTIVKVCSEAHILEKGRVVFAGPPEVVVRRHLYGEELSEPYERGVANITSRPAPLSVRQGERFAVKFGANLLRDEPVSAVSVIERLRTGAGWETMLMTREPILVGRSRGAYSIEVSLDATALPPGDYIFGASLVQPLGKGGGYRIFDSFGWLSGSGVPLRVESEPGAIGCVFPARWDLRQP